MVNILHQEFSLQMAVDFHSRHFQDKDGAEKNGKALKSKLTFLELVNFSTVHQNIHFVASYYKKYED